MGLNDPIVERLEEANINSPDDVDSLGEAAIVFGMLTSQVKEMKRGIAGDDISKGAIRREIEQKELEITQELEQSNIPQNRKAEIRDIISEASEIIRKNVIGIEVREEVKEAKKRQAQDFGLSQDDIQSLSPDQRREFGVGQPKQNLQESVLEFIQQNFDSERELAAQTEFDTFEEAAAKIVQRIMEELGLGGGGIGQAPGTR